MSLFSSLPQHIFGVIICIYLGALSWLCMLSKAYICCGIGIEKKINMALLMVTKSGEAGNSSKAKIQAFALPT